MRIKIVYYTPSLWKLAEVWITVVEHWTKNSNLHGLGEIESNFLLMAGIYIRRQHSLYLSIFFSPLQIKFLKKCRINLKFVSAVVFLVCHIATCNIPISIPDFYVTVSVMIKVIPV